MFKVWYRNFIVWTHYKGTSLIINLGEPFLYLFAFGYGLGRYVTSFNGLSYIQFIAPALVVASTMNSASFETTFSSYTRMEVQKTFDAIVVTPLTLRQVVLGEILWATTKGCFTAVIMMIVFLFAGLISHPFAIFVLILCLVEGILFSALGMLMTSIAKSYDFFSAYLTLFISPMFLLSGTFFPLEELPSWAKTVAWFLPLTHAVNGSRELFAGRVSLSLLFSFIWLAVVAALLTLFAVKKMEKRLIV